MKLSFIGDVNFRNFDEITFEKSKEILSEIEGELDSSDYRIVNLETPLADKTIYPPIIKSGPNHMYSPECVSFLKALNTDVAILANNHMGDYGPGALRDTINLLDENNIKHIGAGENINEAYRSIRLENVSLIAVCENEFGLATRNSCGTAAYNPRMIYNSIQKERQVSEYVIIIFHGGNEFNPLPSPGVVDRYRMLCDMGADAVVAGHTHCPQGYEIYDGKPIVYSMGNFMFQSSSMRDSKDSWYYGYVTQLEISDTGIAMDIVPYKFDTTARITVFKDDKKTRMLNYLDKISKIIANKDELCKYYMGWCYNHQWFLTAPSQYGNLKNSLSPQVNILNCEAHCEMLRENYRILNDGEEDTAKDYSEKILELSIMPV